MAWSISFLRLLIDVLQELFGTVEAFRKADIAGAVTYLYDALPGAAERIADLLSARFIFTALAILAIAFCSYFLGRWRAFADAAAAAPPAAAQQLVTAPPSVRKPVTLADAQQHALASVSTTPQERNRGAGEESLLLSLETMHIEHGDCKERWLETELQNCRFTRGKRLVEVWFLHISATINGLRLSPQTNYAAYFVFKMRTQSEGFDNKIQETVIDLGDDDPVCNNVCLGNWSNGNAAGANGINLRRQLSNDYFEVEMGEFYGRGSGDASLTLKNHNTSYRKKGLVVAGIEIRPKSSTAI